MTNANYTHILTIVDRSGSMMGIKKDMVGGLDSLFEEQAKLPGVCLVDYVQFDTTVDTVFEDKHVDTAKAVLEPRGWTALLDAIGQSVTRLGEKLAKKHETERPGKVIVVIVTDGYENASKEWKPEKVKELVKNQTDLYNWDFVFLGANMDAVGVGAGLGIAGSSSLTYDVNNTGQTMAFANNYVTQTRTRGSAAFTDEERQKAVN